MTCFGKMVSHSRLLVVTCIISEFFLRYLFCPYFLPGNKVNMDGNAHCDWHSMNFFWFITFIFKESFLIFWVKCVLILHFLAGKWSFNAEIRFWVIRYVYQNCWLSSTNLGTNFHSYNHEAEKRSWGSYSILSCLFIYASEIL